MNASPLIILKSLLFLIILLSTGSFCRAQPNDIQFLKEKIKLNYPGFSTKAKGIEFDSLVLSYTKRYHRDTFKVLASMVHFFNDQHLQIFQPKEYIHVDTPRCKMDLGIIKNHLLKGRKSPLEGYWLDDYNACVVGIKQESAHPERYSAYVLECRDMVLLPGFQMMRFEKMSDGRYFTDYYDQLTGKRHFVKSVFRNDSVITTGPDAKWKKMSVYSGSILERTTPFSSLSQGQVLDSNTYLLTIPGSTEINVRRVDSIVREDCQRIVSRPNLIVDIRNNMGGTVRVYEPLLRLIFTNPIARIRAQTFGTEDYVRYCMKQVREYIAEGQVDSADLKEWLASISTIQENIGKFTPDDERDTLRYDSIYSHPQKVGVIINYACQSAAEMLLLDFKQSKKVTLFGENTMGAVDYLDFYPLMLPSGKYKLYIATSRRVIPEGQTTIDGKGIAPNVRISDIEPDWVNFVRRYYEKP